MGLGRPCSAKLKASEEAMVVEFRQRAMMPLDDMLGHLHGNSPTLRFSTTRPSAMAVGSYVRECSRYRTKSTPSD